MKKIIGILGIAIIAMAMFFSSGIGNGSNDNLDLASLIATNTANAEITPVAGCRFGYFSICRRTFFDVTNCYNSTFGPWNCGI